VKMHPGTKIRGAIQASQFFTISRADALRHRGLSWLVQISRDFPACAPMQRPRPISAGRHSEFCPMGGTRRFVATCVHPARVRARVSRGLTRRDYSGFSPAPDSLRISNLTGAPGPPLPQRPAGWLGGGTDFPLPEGRRRGLRPQWTNGRRGPESGGAAGTETIADLKSSGQVIADSSLR